MGCTLHQHGHGHSHGGGSGGGGHTHGHSHGPAVLPADQKSAEVKNNSYVPGSVEDLERAEEQASHASSGEHDESSCSSNSTQVSISKQQNINVRAAYIHVIGDFLQSVGVFAAALTIYFQVNISSISYIVIFNLFATTRH